MPDDTTTIGTILRGARARADLTQEQAADAARSTQTSISLIELDRRVLGHDLLRRLAVAYHMTDEEIGRIVRMGGGTGDVTEPPADSARG